MPAVYPSREMKRLLLSLVGLTAFSGGAALVTWFVAGPPDRSVPCDPGNLPENHVCFATVREWEAADVLWVDARPRDYWERDGIEGSILVNDQEEWMVMEEPFVLAVFGDGSHLKSKVVVYCNQSGCSSSTYVADRLREKHGEALGFDVYVLHGGVKAFAEEVGN